jgi:hypothetical protein
MTTAPHGDLRRRDLHPLVKQLASLRSLPRVPRVVPLAQRYCGARALLALPGKCFDWSSCADADSALLEVNALIAVLDAIRLPNRRVVSVLFAPTGPIQDVSKSRGRADEFLDLADRFDEAKERAYDQCS